MIDRVSSLLALFYSAAFLFGSSFATQGPSVVPVVSMTARTVLRALHISSVAGTAASWSSAQPIRRVVVVGGTHGNEYTGVWCIKALDRNPPTDYPSLDVSTLLGNPKAHYANKRFIHSDLNREFVGEKLASGRRAESLRPEAGSTEDCPEDGEEFIVDGEGTPRTAESIRAQEVDQLLGPKLGDQNPAADLVVDLHSTTSNMGTTIIIVEGDQLMARAAAYVLHECGGEEGDTRILMHCIPNRKERPNLASTARHGFTIEVGPVPQGVLRHDAVEKTQKALMALFQFLQRSNEDADSIDQHLKECYPTGKIPCYRSALSNMAGQMSSKIEWPVDDENPNFPALMIHKSVQDRDFHSIRKGDALFVDLAGNIIPYDGSYGEEVQLMFVNEGGYYYSSSGTGIGVAVATEFDLEKGKLSPMTDEKVDTLSTFGN